MRRWLIVFVAAVLLTALLGGYKVMQIREAIAFAESFPEQTEAVQAVVASEIEWTPSVSAVGNVVAPQAVTLSNELAGRVAEVGFAAGAAVEKGQLLLRLDTSQEQAELAGARARAQLARTQLNRLQELLDRSVASQDEVDEAQAALSVATAEAAALEAIIDKQILRAPFAARAGLHTLEIGQYLAAGTQITRLVGIEDTLWVDFALPQQLTALAIGSEVSVSAPGLLDQPAPAAVIARDAALSDASRNRTFRASLAGHSHELPPATIVRVEVPTGETRPVVVLPATAVRRSGFAAHVYVIAGKSEDGEEVLRAELRTVQVGDQRDDQIVILDGVRAGERVAASGSFKLRDGMKVHLTPEATVGPSVS